MNHAETRSEEVRRDTNLHEWGVVLESAGVGRGGTWANVEVRREGLGTEGKGSLGE